MRRSIQRRDFLKVAGGAAAWALTRGGWADEAPAKPQHGFSIGIQSYSLRGYPVDKAIEIARELGCEHIEFFDAHFPLNSSDSQIGELQQKMAGLRISAHGVNGFGSDHEANRRIFDFAKRAGIRNISADPHEDAFESLDKLVAEYDIRVAIHNHGPGARYDKVADVLNAIQGHDERIGACADLGHYIRSSEDPVRVIDLLKGRLFGIHLKDFAEQQANTKGVILGKGHLDVASVFKALKKVEFPADGALSLEYEENPADPVADIKECLRIAHEGAAQAVA